VQIVDSQFLLQLACGKIDLQRFLDGYALGALLKGRALQGWFFEYMVHGWFESKKPAPMASACRSVGNAAQGVAMLTQPNMYWVPSTCNFPAIDSAIIIGETLYTFQMTVADTHSFEWDKFTTSFLYSVTLQFPNIDSVILYYVVPSDSQFDVSKIQDKLPKLPEPLNDPSTAHKRKFRDDDITYSCSRLDIKTDTLLSVSESLEALPLGETLTWYPCRIVGNVGCRASSPESSVGCWRV
jgi:hypothetical protein